MISAKNAFRLLAPLLLAVCLAGCGEKASHNDELISSSTDTNLEIHPARGIVKELRPNGKTIVVRHEAITNYMPAMTMPMDVRNPKDLIGLAPGDTVTFNIVVATNDSWLEQVRKIDAPHIEEPPSQSPLIHVLKDVEPLKEGDPLPEYHFTNQFGNFVSTTQFHGQALSITFMFSRCPLPNFCPLMSANFGETQDKLLALTNAPTNWHLLTISFDPEFDNSAILKLYSARYHCDPARWDFVTGSPDTIAAICDQVGLIVEHDAGGAINHNLRTVVIDAAGRVQKIFIGNEWTSDELVAEMVTAARSR